MVWGRRVAPIASEANPLTALTELAEHRPRKDRFLLRLA